MTNMLYVIVMIDDHADYNYVLRRQRPHAQRPAYFIHCGHLHQVRGGVKQESGSFGTTTSRRPPPHPPGRQERTFLAKNFEMLF